MSIEIDILNGDASWSIAEPLHSAVWPRHSVEKQPWGHILWADADLRVDGQQVSGEALAARVGRAVVGMAGHGVGVVARLDRRRAGRR